MQPKEVEQGLSLSQEALTQLPDELLALTLRRCHHTVTKSVHPPGEKAVEGFIKQVRSKQKRGEMQIQGIKIIKEQKRFVFCVAAEATH